MRDPEFISLRNRLLICILIVSIFALTLIFFIYRLSGVGGSSIYNRVLKKESFIIFVKDKDCDKCDAVEDILDEEGIKYYVLDRYKDNNTKIIYQRIKLEDDINTPCIMNIKKGKVYSYIDSISDKNSLNDYINSDLR